MVVDAINGPIDNLEIEATGALVGPEGATIPTDDMTIYREEFYEVSAAAGKPRSSRQGGEGLWPDALIPERDPYYGENRAAFPIDVAAGDKEIAWESDVFVAAGAPAGEYTGELEVGPEAAGSQPSRSPSPSPRWRCP